MKPCFPIQRQLKWIYERGFLWKGAVIMGSYLNPTCKNFMDSRRSEIYVDKSGLIAKTNAVIDTQQKYICVSRPRRFGKSMAADMLAAYYSRGKDNDGLFNGLKIQADSSYTIHLNQYDVIKLNMQVFLSSSRNVDTMLERLTRYLITELLAEYPDFQYLDVSNFFQIMQDIFAQTKRPFVILIDEWDCLFREFKEDAEAQRLYLDFLRGWLKDQPYVGLAYMTGILPIKKYGTHSALNMFSEFSMTNPGGLGSYFGFTEEEVRVLCERYDMNFEEAKAWYDGYTFSEPEQLSSHPISIYSPKSIVEAMLHRCFQNYWNQTETYEALKLYIQMNFDGLKDAVVTMLAGGKEEVNPGKFKNDMITFSGKNDVLILLVHLGYLSFDFADKSVTIPNKEVSAEYINAIEDLGWSEVLQSVESSRRLLNALWDMEEEAVAAGIDRAHREVSILQYNDENALSYTINLAFYFAREYYTIIREFPSGKGFADICMIPRKLHADKPAVLIELKWDQSADGAIKQIKEKHYTDALKEYKGNLLLAGINYNQKSKNYQCNIEKMEL